MCFCMCVVFLFFFFKPKTAYEMRISDWSSDVCSSDLNEDGREIRAGEKSRETGGEEGNTEKANGHDREEDLETGGEEVLTNHAGAPAARRAESIGRWTSSSPPCACYGSPAKSGSSGIVAPARSEERRVGTKCVRKL